MTKKRINVYLNDDELNQLKEKANMLGLSDSSFVRMLILSYFSDSNSEQE